VLLLVAETVLTRVTVYSQRRAHNTDEGDASRSWCRSQRPGMATTASTQSLCDHWSDEEGDGESWRGGTARHHEDSHEEEVMTSLGLFRHCKAEVMPGRSARRNNNQR
jgi:hypothetical protein